MTEEQLNVGATILAQTDAIAALIAVLTHQKVIDGELLKVALEGVQEKHPETEQGPKFMSSPNYKATINAFMAATRKDF